ncbi:MAG: hypothetical protein LIP10_04270 [Clostridiales bacterium]|nr:hypothetical protein [Clostridiales bacterium]
METVFLISHKEYYFYPYEDACLQITKNTRRYYVIARLCSTFGLALPKWCWDRNAIPEEVKTIVITDAVFQPSLYKALKKEYHDKRFVLYHMNLLRGYNRCFRSYCSEAYTFDQSDAEQFGIAYRHTPYTDRIRKMDCAIETDALFLGRDKNRLQKIRQAKQTLEAAGLRTRFYVYETKDAELRMDSYMSYEDYLDQVMRAECLVEINIPGQSGCSLRFLEALFFRKKLITDNAAIRQDPWYRRENVYILGEEEDRPLQEFIKTPYSSEGLDLSELVFSNWLHGFE